MKDIVEKEVKAFLLLVLCVALVMTSAGFAPAVWANEVSAQPGVSESAGQTETAEVPGSGGTEKEPSGSDAQKETGENDTQKETDDSNTQKETGDKDTETEPGSGNTPEEPGKNDTETEPGKDDTETEPGKDDTETEPDEKEKPVKVSVSVKLTENKKAAKISWKKVNGAYTYKIKRSSKKNSGFKTIASLSNGYRSYKDTSVKKGSRYYYRVIVQMTDGSTCSSETSVLNCPLGKVSGVKLIRYSTSSIKVTWNPSSDKNTKWYKVYYAKSKNGKYKLAGTTANYWYRVKKLANYQNYYFHVQACVSKKSSGMDSSPSKTVMMTTKPYERLTIFAGDSITTGLTSYGTVNKINIGGKKKVVAAIGLNTITFRTKRVFNGLSATQSIAQDKPYRVYIMLGNNDIHYRNKKDVIDGYRNILNVIWSASPETDIVVLAVAPVTAATKNRRTGFQQIPAYNQDLKALAEKMGARFYDCTGFMKDSGGWLKSSYAAGDGIHWQPFVYDQYAKLLESYDKSLD